MPSSEAEVATLKADLIRAGFRSENAVPVFYGLRIISTLVMLVLCIDDASRSMPPNPMMKHGADGFGLRRRAGFCRDSSWRRRWPNGRKSCGFRCPTRSICWWSRWKPAWAWTRPSSTWPASCKSATRELSEEMSLVTLEMRAGKRRSDALRNFAERTGEAGNPQAGGHPDSERPLRHQHGRIPAHAFRFHAHARRQEAEERAGKVGVKLVFPIFFFILPSMLIVAAGPGHSANFQVSVPDDETNSLEEGENKR